MSKVDQRFKQNFCQSRFYKNWNPDYLADYNSLKDKHLKCYFKKSKTKKQLMVVKQITEDGRIVNEKDWRRENIEIERKTKEREDEKKRKQQKEIESKNNRIEILQKIRQEEKDRKKVEERRRLERGIKDSLFSYKQNELVEKEMKKVVDLINYEIEYVLRPKTAPMRPPAAPNLKTSKRAGRSQSLENKAISKGGRGFPRILGRRSVSPHPLSPDGVFPVTQKTCGTLERRKQVRNIEVPSSKLSDGDDQDFLHRPKTAPNNIYRSPTHPHFKEDVYRQSRVVLRYDGPGEADLDEVIVQQQPRGTYTLPVFKGMLSVGDEFWFISRRVDGHPWSITIFINKRSHVRLSNCCESKRTVGARLGQGVFTLVKVEGAEPCIKCVMDQDPVVKKQVAKIAKYRGEYDRWGNRLTKTMLNTKHLLENSNDDIFKTIQKEIDDDYYVSETSDVEDDYFDSKRRDLKLDLSAYKLEHPANLTLDNYNSRQCVQCTKKEVDDLIYNPAEDSKHQKKRDYKEQQQFEHTYSSMKGNGYIPRQKLKESKLGDEVVFKHIEEERNERVNEKVEENDYENEIFYEDDAESKGSIHNDYEENYAFELKRLNLKTQDGRSTKDISIIEESIENANENDTLNRASSLERDQIDELPYEQESFENDMEEEEIIRKVESKSHTKGSKYVQTSEAKNNHVKVEKSIQVATSQMDKNIQAEFVVDLKQKGVQVEILKDVEKKSVAVETEKKIKLNQDIRRGSILPMPVGPMMGIGLGIRPANTDSTVPKEKEEKRRMKDEEIDWDDPRIDELATQVQAGFKGLLARDRLREEEIEIKKIVEKKNKEIEAHLGIDLTDPEVIKATTTIQAGFRGVLARNIMKRPSTPTVIISKPESESESVASDEEEGSEWSYIYEDEDDEDYYYDSRPGSPKTAIEDFPLTIGGFKCTFGISAWLKRSKENIRQRKEKLEDIEYVASYIQAGYRGMIVREQMRQEDEEYNESLIKNKDLQYQQN